MVFLLIRYKCIFHSEQSEEIKLHREWGIFNEARYNTREGMCTESKAPFMSTNAAERNSLLQKTGK